MDKEYDSDYQWSSFAQDDVEHEEFHSMDEVALEVPIETTLVLNKEEDKYVTMTGVVLEEEVVSKLNVVELRNALPKRGLILSGLKGVLQTRLTEAVKNGDSIVEDRPRNEIIDQA